MKKYLLGVDLGTTNVKAMLFSEDGKICACEKGEARKLPNDLRTL